MGGLPEKFAIGFVERHEIPAVAGQFGIVKCFVVCSDKDLSTDDKRSGVALGTEFCCPFNIFAGFQVPIAWDIDFIGYHVPA